MFDSRKDVGALQEGGFQRDCLQMELRSNAEGGRVYRGPGRIDQEPDGQLRFTLYVPEADPHSDLYLPLGTILPSDRYWTLTASAYDGGRWECSRLVVNPGWSQPGGGTVITANLPYLEGREQEPISQEGSGFEGFVFHHFDLAANRRTMIRTNRDTEWREEGRWDAAVTEVGDVRFLLHQTDEQLRVTAYRKTAGLHPHFHERLREALQFTFAYPLSWAATIDTEGRGTRVYIRGRPTPRLNPRIRPPVPANLVHGERHVWELFRAYFAHVCKDETAESHRLSSEWNEVLRSSTASLETEALVCSIAVESVCRHLHRGGAAPIQQSAPDATGWADRIDEFLERAGCDLRTRRRVAGLFTKMVKQDHTDFLLALQQRGAIDANLVEGWSSWRHIMAHGDREAQRELPALYEACDRLVTLLYQLYFFSIDYRGPYTYFAAPGWPVRTYPPANKAPAKSPTENS